MSLVKRAIKTPSATTSAYPRPPNADSDHYQCIEHEGGWREGRMPCSDWRLGNHDGPRNDILLLESAHSMALDKWRVKW
jgi:hypothetical protein